MENRLTDREFERKMIDSESTLLSYARTLKSPNPEDLVQDTFARMWVNKHNYKEEGTFNAWAKRVMKNIFITQAVKEDKMKYRRDEEDEWTIFDYISSLKAYNPAITSITLDDIEESIERVFKDKPIDKYIVTEFLKGTSQAELAIELNKKRNNIKQRYFWAIRDLRDDLAKKFNIDPSEYQQSSYIQKKQVLFHKKKAQEEYMYRKLRFSKDEE